MRFAKIGILTLVIATLLAACATQPPPPYNVELPGFLVGFGHGFISPFALIVELFKDVRIYAFPNGGGWYDLGFMLGVGTILGGGGAGAAA